jgi:toxin ParE1/3/4
MSTREVLWAEVAERDLADIVGFIAEENPQNALAVLDRLQSRAATLSEQSERGRVVPELRVLDVYQYRELIERPWRIIYRIEADRVLVLAVLDGRRALESLLLQRLLKLNAPD